MDPKVADDALDIASPVADVPRPFPLDKELSAQKGDGKPTVVVTGSSSGIGLQAARSLANEVRRNSLRTTSLLHRVLFCLDGASAVLACACP
eukprot:1094811-Rhodomonas_salina.2